MTYTRCSEYVTGTFRAGSVGSIQSPKSDAEASATRAAAIGRSVSVRDEIGGGRFIDNEDYTLRALAALLRSRSPRAASSVVRCAEAFGRHHRTHEVHGPSWR